jgi:hypothetical protein
VLVGGADEIKAMMSSMRTLMTSAILVQLYWYNTTAQLGDSIDIIVVAVHY